MFLAFFRTWGYNRELVVRGLPGTKVRKLQAGFLIFLKIISLKTGVDNLNVLDGTAVID
jgi:hypothetical protein